MSLLNHEAVSEGRAPTPDLLKNKFLTYRSDKNYQMILSDKHIREAIQSNKIRIKPQIDYETQLGSCSIDLHLNKTFRVFEYSRYPYFDVKSEAPLSDYTREIVIEDHRPFVLHPRGFVLASTIEWVELEDDIAARLEGRSSLGRLGIIVHSTAGLFDPGWEGEVVIELGNLGVMPVALYPGMRICALTFEQVSSRVEIPYRKKSGSKYSGQTGPTASKIFEDKDQSLK
jgi:dCTP deaminase